MKEFIERIQTLSQKQLVVLAAELKKKLDEAPPPRQEAFAIVGMSCRFPGLAYSPQAFWQLLHEGKDAIVEVPPDRWDVDKHYDTDIDAPAKTHTRSGGFLHDVRSFDASFFEISPREAVNLDPQQRMLLEVSWEAFESANMTPDKLHDSRTGVFIGISGAEYLLAQLIEGQRDLNAYMGSGTAQSVAAGRISYALGLRGPSIAIDTACSSSLVAIHLACESIKRGECDLAVAGAANLMLVPQTTAMFSKARMLSPDGRCKTFDESADGFARGEGCGAIVIKRLADALADRDHILAVVRGSALNQDGANAGLTVPSGKAQAAVIRDALKAAGLSPGDVSYIEAHGTGTSLGDPIELCALGDVFGASHDRERAPLWVGSVKTNIGHLEAAAGIAGTIKVVLSLMNRRIPPHLNFKTASSRIPWDELPIRIPTGALAWEHQGKPRVAGISSFSFMGTNAHLLLEEAPGVDADGQPGVPPFLLKISAKTAAALREEARLYRDALDALPAEDLARFCYTANVGRGDFKYRAVFVAEDKDSLCRQLTAAGADAASMEPEALAGKVPPKVAFVYGGQVSLGGGAGAALYRRYRVFKDAVDRCAQALGPLLASSLVDVVCGAASDERDRRSVAHAAFFTLQYALTALWNSCGVVPDAVAGIGCGEVAAACAAGVLSPEDAVRLVWHIADLVEKCADTTALVKGAEPPPRLIAAGEASALAGLVAELDASGLASGDGAAAEAFRVVIAALRGTGFHPSRLPMLGNGGDVTAWLRQMGAPTPLHDAAALRRLDASILVEVGPVTQPAVSGAPLWLAGLKPADAGVGSWLCTLGALYRCGSPIRWEGLHADQRSRKLLLPTYPFQRQSFWFELTAARPDAPHADAAAVTSIASIPPPGSRDRHFDIVVGADAVVGALVPALLIEVSGLSAGRPATLGNIRLADGLRAAAGGARRMHAVVAAADADAPMIALSSESRDAACRSWRLCAEADIVSPVDDAGKIDALRAKLRGFAGQVDASAFYRRAERLGHAFTEATRRLSLGTAEPGAFIWRLRSAVEAETPVARFSQAFEAGFQALSFAINSDRLDENAYVPRRIERLEMAQTPGRFDPLWCCVELAAEPGEADGSGLRVGHVYLFDQALEFAAGLVGVALYPDASRDKASPVEASPADTAGRVAEILGLPEPDQLRAVAAHLRDVVATVTGADPEALEATKPLSALGIDSLMAFEVRARLRRRLAVQPSFDEILGDGDMSRLSASLLERIKSDPAACAAAEVPVVETELVAVALDDTDGAALEVEGEI